MTNTVALMPKRVNMCHMNELGGGSGLPLLNTPQSIYAFKVYIQGSMDLTVNNGRDCMLHVILCWDNGSNDEESAK